MFSSEILFREMKQITMNHSGIKLECSPDLKYVKNEIREDLQTIIKIDETKFHQESLNVSTKQSCQFLLEHLSLKNNITGTQQCEVYQCYHCLKIFKRKKDLPRHIMSVHMRIKYPCTICPREFQNKASLNHHLASHAGKTYECENCSKIFNSKHKLYSHKRKDHMGLTYSCFMCNKTITSKNSLRDHIHLFHGREKLFSCELCPQTFTYSTTLKRHIKNIHGADIHTCDVCLKQFSSPRSLQYHQKTVHSDVKYPCEKCSEFFSTKECLRNHQKRHSDMKIRYKCNQCEKSWAEKKGLKLHLENNHFGNIRRYACPEPRCSKSYSMKQSLAMHIKKMNREPEQHYDKPKQVEFPCVYCGKIFPRLGLLKEHTKTHHLKVRYTCDICSQDYSTKYYLKLHKQVHEGKQHECEKCSRLFPSSKMLYDHTMRSHKTRELFKCHQCSRKYMSKPSLRRHIYATHINKGVRFSCHLCGKSFHREQSLRKHLREEENQDQLHCDKCRYKTFLKSNLIAHVHGYHRLAITLN